MLLSCFDEFIIRIVDPIWEPISFSKVVINPRWKFIMLEEMESVSHNQTWQLVEPPLGKKPITAKWIYKVKNDSSG